MKIIGYLDKMIGYDVNIEIYIYIYEYGNI